MADSDQDTVMPNDHTPEEPRTDLSFTPNRSAVSTPERDSPTDNNPPQHAQRTERTNSETEDAAISIPPENRLLSPKDETKMFLQNEASARSPKKTGTKPCLGWSVITFTESIMGHKFAKKIGTLK